MANCVTDPLTLQIFISKAVNVIPLHKRNPQVFTVQKKKKKLLNFLKFGLRISLELPINWWQNLYLSSKQATTVLILFQESSRNLMLLFTMDVASSLLSFKLLSFPHGVGLVWEARMSKPLSFLCYVLSIDHHLLFWSTAFLKSPTDSHACSHVTKMVCCWSDSKIPDLYRFLDLYGCESYCVPFPCELQDLYISFSFSCLLLDSQQSSFWSIKMSLLPALSV